MWAFAVLDFVVHILNVSWQISRPTQWIQTLWAFVVLDFVVHTLSVSWQITRVTQWIQSMYPFVVCDFAVHTLNVSWQISSHSMNTNNVGICCVWLCSAFVVYTDGRPQMHSLFCCAVVFRCLYNGGCGLLRRPLKAYIFFILSYISILT
jgi:hypothetical protein